MPKHPATRAADCCGRRFCRGAMAAAAVVLSCSLQAQVQVQPSPASSLQPTSSLLPCAAGGANDLLVRTFAQAASQRWGQAVLVKQSGVAATMATAAKAYSAAPAGDTISMTSTTLHNAFLAASSKPQWPKALEVQGQPAVHMDSDQYRRFAIAPQASDKRLAEELGFKRNG